MIITQPALMCLNATWQRLTRGVEPAQFSDDLPLVSEAAAAAAAPAPELSEPVLAADHAREELSPLPEPFSQTRNADPDAPLSANERRARAAALRALAFSRARHFDAARAAFTEAARLDPALDLTRTPSFWALERAAHEAAIDAYLETGRDGDAAVLRARVRSTYRPKALRTRAGAAVS
jgi:hypothetical protein